MLLTRRWSGSGIWEGRGGRGKRIEEDDVKESVPIGYGMIWVEGCGE